MRPRADSIVDAASIGTIADDPIRGVNTPVAPGTTSGVGGAGTSGFGAADVDGTVVAVSVAAEGSAGGLVAAGDDPPMMSRRARRLSAESAAAFVVSALRRCGGCCAEPGRAGCWPCLTVGSVPALAGFTMRGGLAFATFAISVQYIDPSD